MIVLYVLMNTLSTGLVGAQADWVIHSFEVKQALRTALIYHLKGNDDVAQTFLQNALELTADNQSQQENVTEAMQNLLKRHYPQFNLNLQEILTTEDMLLIDRRRKLKLYRQILIMVKNTLSIGLIAALFILLGSLKRLNQK